MTASAEMRLDLAPLESGRPRHYRSAGLPNADFFSAVGLFVVRGFLDSDTCGRLRAEVRDAETRAATVKLDGGEYDVDQSTRSTELAAVSADGFTLVEERLSAVMPDVASHYGLELSRWQRVQFLVYREGDFFRPHRDRDEKEDAPAFSRERQVAAVVFLNGDGDPATADAFRGGALTLYGLFDRADGDTIGFPLEAEEGLLITFPTDVVHEVRPVEAGERKTVVTWFV
jgi:predicted 2-oxoglutarate/Fe(II)-dependent dioxygenase YbiX